MIRKAHHFLLMVLLCGTYACLPPFVQAGITIKDFGLSTEEVVRISATPTQAEAGEKVTMKLEATSVPLSGATINWKRNGATISEAENSRMYTFKAGELGTTERVEVTITPVSGNSVSATYTFVVHDIDILIEPQTYVPAEYEGGALPSSGADVRAIAMAHLYKNGVRIPEKELTYTWRLNGASIRSGGADSARAVTFTPRDFREDILSVRVETKDHTISAERSVAPRMTEPKMLWYEESSLTGRDAIAKTNFTTSKSEMTVRAEPYFLNRETYYNSGRLTHRWEVNGSVVPNPGDAFSILLQNTSLRNTDANVSASFGDTVSALQKAIGTFIVRFSYGDTMLGL